LNISACLIVKNEEKYLNDCLESLRFCDEVILVDTGSTDKTLQIAKQFANVKIFKKTFWKYFISGWKLKRLFNFSEARNYGLSKATKDWILIIDADERVENPVNIGELIKNENADAWRLDQITHTEQGDVPCSSTRIWRNGLGIKYRKLVHETVDEYLQENKIRIGKTDIRISHVGYKDSSKDKERSRRIIEAIKYEKQPYMNYYLGIAYHQAGDIERATDHFNKSLFDTMPNEIKAHSHALLADIYRLSAEFYLNMAKERISHSTTLIPNQNLSHLIMAEIYKLTGQRNMALKQYKHLRDKDTTKSNLHQDLLLDRKQVQGMVTDCWT